MKLYELAMTPSAKRVNIFLNEIGIELNRHSINLGAGDNLSDEFKALSVNGLIPVLQLHLIAWFNKMQPRPSIQALEH
jgi:glutathione S-transferase